MLARLSVLQHQTASLRRVRQQVLSSYVVDAELVVRIFFDTEFNGFREASRLLSIGFAAEDGREFYLELPPQGPHLTGADDFVLATVVAQFNRVPESQVPSLAEMGRRVRDFLASFEDSLELHFDYKLDWRHLEHILSIGGDESWRDRVLCVDASGWMNDVASVPAIEVVRARFYARGMRQHHALVDACMMRAGVCAAPEV